ncbi:hypothetical protein ASE14_15090 [Agromyces sp. Root81]|uniref:hypothetical protein n=1 Tax=Agromyces sp. Root81 TaxID=1736601 RepID=UPI0006FE334C|nr:hypothetical protein [Agromyces sp. Root81]KRC59107.1 hypothetical protein ASE14_15090 [Agromyces sp. Root81]
MNAPEPTEAIESVALEFENGTLPPAQLSHRVHLALGWHYLQRDGFPAGAATFCEHLQRYVQAVGAIGKYHETITWAYLVLLNEERTLRAEPGETFDAMIARRPDLLDHRAGALRQCYTAEELDAPEARTTFMLPRGAG